MPSVIGSTDSSFDSAQTRFILLAPLYSARTPSNEPLRGLLFPVEICGLADDYGCTTKTVAPALAHHRSQPLISPIRSFSGRVRLAQKNGAIALSLATT